MYNNAIDSHNTSHSQCNYSDSSTQHNLLSASFSLTISSKMKYMYM